MPTLLGLLFGQTAGVRRREEGKEIEMKAKNAHDDDKKLKVKTDSNRICLTLIQLLDESGSCAVLLGSSLCVRQRIAFTVECSLRGFVPEAVRFHL